MTISQQARWKRLLFTLSLLAFVLAGCERAPTPTPFIPPTRAQSTPTTEGQDIVPAPLPSLPAESITAEPGGELLPSLTPACTASLKYVQDVTIPDDTLVAPTAPVDKRWLVQNDGTCDWDSHYRLKLESGTEMGLAGEQALYPARAGSQAMIEMIFTAPTDAGTYRSAWRAYAPDGTAFGETVYVEIIVSP